jgi:hypothetical protein
VKFKTATIGTYGGAAYGIPKKDSVPFAEGKPWNVVRPMETVGAAVSRMVGSAQATESREKATATDEKVGVMVAYGFSNNAKNKIGV